MAELEKLTLSDLIGIIRYTGSDSPYGPEDDYAVALNALNLAIDSLSSFADDDSLVRSSPTYRDSVTATLRLLEVVSEGLTYVTDYVQERISESTFAHPLFGTGLTFTIILDQSQARLGCLDVQTIAASPEATGRLVQDIAILSVSDLLPFREPRGIERIIKSAKDSLFLPGRGVLSRLPDINRLFPQPRAAAGPSVDLNAVYMFMELAVRRAVEDPSRSGESSAASGRDKPLKDDLGATKMPELKKLTLSDLDAILAVASGSPPEGRDAGSATFAENYLLEVLGELNAFLKNRGGDLDPDFLADARQTSLLLNVIESVVTDLQEALGEIFGMRATVLVVEGQKRAGEFFGAEMGEASLRVGNLLLLAQPRGLQTVLNSANKTIGSESPLTRLNAAQLRALEIDVYGEEPGLAINLAAVNRFVDLAKSMVRDRGAVSGSEKPLDELVISGSDVTVYNALEGDITSLEGAVVEVLESYLRAERLRVSPIDFAFNVSEAEKLEVLAGFEEGPVVFVTADFTGDLPSDVKLAIDAMSRPLARHLEQVTYDFDDDWFGLAQDLKYLARVR
ncbi:MAG: hypothetical protein ACXAEN_16870 [Candidatus Thorarchaeota archaeon]